MNLIEGVLFKNNEYVDVEYINIRIDNVWLDEKLDELYPDNMYRGLIPTLVEWMDREDEKAVVWRRILPGKYETTICPVLMCPDENDFSCTLIVAEITNLGTHVRWSKLGVDLSNEWEAEKVGSKVEWFENVKEMNFEFSDYIKMLDNFKERL
ncbi:hypothetical protein [Flectobacillus sp. BAB-3569]|uniref:hypothetical protein n=1 Tax=Flectobacillus sp. BAB-3569 TaxID=1509483 RepID=UPI000BA4658C|nr:hypothetical protein [Flectobacillus sp. BAB-3569]PAC26720.1 hypothetical protein BWI92_25030 [Flectobacillus sp. BAB-3569]